MLSDCLHLFVGTNALVAFNPDAYVTPYGPFLGAKRLSEFGF